MKICRICGTKIEFTSRAHKYCSEECRKRVKYEKDRAWLLARPGKAAEYSRKHRAENPGLANQQAKAYYKRKILKQIKEESGNG